MVYTQGLLKVELRFVVHSKKARAIKDEKYEMRMESLTRKDCMETAVETRILSFCHRDGRTLSHQCVGWPVMLPGA